jgi:ribulose-5-phosphate 4-epimerase/fuculose-1-phosphate aldolase
MKPIQKLIELDYFPGNTGNISKKTWKEYFVITKTGSSISLYKNVDVLMNKFRHNPMISQPLDDLLVPVYLDGPIPEKASSEAPVHKAIYEFNPEINCIIHSHHHIFRRSEVYLPWDLKKKIPQIITRRIDYPRPNPSKAAKIAEIFQDGKVKIVFLNNHGLIAVGKTFLEIYNLLELYKNELLSQVSSFT